MVEWLREKPCFELFLQKHKGNGFYALGIKVNYKGHVGYVLTEMQMQKETFNVFGAQFPDEAKLITDQCDKIVAALGDKFSFSAFKHSYKALRPISKRQLIMQHPAVALDPPVILKMNVIIEKLENIQRLLQRDMSIYLNVEEAAEFTKHATNTIRNLVSQKKIPFIKKGGKVVFKKQELIDWLDEGIRGAKTQTTKSNIRI